MLLARVLLFIPHDSKSRFPVHIHSCGKARNWEDCVTACDCGHRFNLLFLKLHAFIRSFDQNALMQSQFHHIAFGTGRKRNRRYDNCRKEIRLKVLLRMSHSARNDPRCFARVGVNRVAKTLNGWQHKWGYARTKAHRSCKRLFPLHVAVMSLRLGWQPGCTNTDRWRQEVCARVAS